MALLSSALGCYSAVVGHFCCQALYNLTILNRDPMTKFGGVLRLSRALVTSLITAGASLNHSLHTVTTGRLDHRSSPTDASRDASA